MPGRCASITVIAATDRRADVPSPYGDGRRARSAWREGRSISSCSTHAPIIGPDLRTLRRAAHHDDWPLHDARLLLKSPGVGDEHLDDAIRGTSGWSWLRGWRRFAPLVLVLAAGAHGLRWWYTDGGAEDWRGASRHVFAESEAGDRIIFANDSTRLFFEYYLRFENAATPPQPVYPDDPWGGYETGDQTYISFDEATIGRLTAEPSERVWVVIGRDHVNTEHVPEVLRGMSTAYDEVERRIFDGDVEVILFAPR
jgi:hypothetical protein